MVSASIYDNPSLYDCVVPPGPCDGFYRELAQKTGGPVLELACGTGRLTVPMSVDGHEVVGLDRSARMLRAAREKARARNVNPTFVLSDMKDFQLQRQFALIVLSCNSLAHLITDDALSACLIQIRKHLAPGGLFAFDLVNPNLLELSSTYLEPQVIADENCAREILGYDPISQVQIVRFSTTTRGSSKAFLPVRLRVIFPQEIEPRLRSAGLTLLRRYGDFEGKPLGSASLNQVCIATRTFADVSISDLGATHAAA
ncbi:class I SAM-dependent methyltransferase [Mesorhizobium sp.]|nr:MULTISPECIES: class I SAM-dependent methyltransferase [unclassified Mesorhizobium]